MASAAAAVAAASAAAAPPLFLPPASSNSRTAAAVETVDFDGLRQHSIRSDLEFIEKELKDWFLCRRLRMERNMALKKLFDHHHFVGLSQNDPTLNAAERSIWKDIVSGKPELEDSLSLDAKEMKADMLMDIFKRATDLEHPCRMPGVAYFRCLRENFKAAQRPGLAQKLRDIFTPEEVVSPPSECRGSSLGSPGHCGHGSAGARAGIRLLQSWQSAVSKTRPVFDLPSRLLRLRELPQRSQTAAGGCTRELDESTGHGGHPSQANVQTQGGAPRCAEWSAKMMISPVVSQED